PGRDGENEVGTRLAVSPRACPPATGSGLEAVAVPEVPERRLTGVDAQEHRAASSAVATVGTAAGDMRLAPEGRGSVASRAGPDPDRHPVEEHLPGLSHGPRDAPNRPAPAAPAVSLPNPALARGEARTSAASWTSGSPRDAL